MAGSFFSSLQSTTPFAYSQLITADTLIKTGAGIAVGLVVNSHTSGTIKIWDALSATGTVLFDTITLAAGPQYFNLFGAKFTTGMYVDIGGTISLTVIYN